MAYAPPVQAAGFSVGEQGAAALGVGGAATARGELGSAGFYNPAALGFSKGPSAAIGASVVMPSIAHVQPGGGARTDADTGAEFPPYVHAGLGLGEFAVGLSFDVPFGAGLSWPTDWAGRFEVTAIELKVFEVAGVVVWRPLDNVAIAAGPRLQRSTVSYERQVDAVDTEGSVHLVGDATGVGGQLAVLYRPTGRLSLGLNYRSRVRLAYDGVADFQDIPPELQQKAHDQPVTTELTVPDRLAVGAAYTFEEATASVDVTYWAWSTFQEFAIDFQDEQTPDVAQPRDWSDSLSVRVGWEQRGLVEQVALRAGLAFDATPSPADTLSPSLPDGHRLVPTVGAGWQLGAGVQIDAAYGHAFIMGAEAADPAFAGRYDAGADLVSVGLSYGR